MRRIVIYLDVILSFVLIFLIGQKINVSHSSKEIAYIDDIENITCNINYSEIDNYILENNYNVSIGYYNLNTNESYYYNKDEIYYGASLVKTVDALYIYENSKLTNTLENKVKKAISVSDNDAHNYLVSYIGYNNLKNYGKQIGMNNFLINSDNYGNTTVDDQIVLWKYLYNFINTNENGDKLKEYFINNYENALAIDNITVMHKYGEFNIYFHDVGIVYAKDPYIIVILTKHGKDDYMSIVNNIAKKVYEVTQSNCLN